MQNKVPITRAEKIKFLSEVKAGKTTIQDILPQRVKVWIINNGITKCDNTGEILTGKKLNERQEKNSNDFFIEIIE